jgi:hypothetical protein
MTTAAKPGGHYTAQAMKVRIDRVNDQAIVTFSALHGLAPVVVHVPLAALDRFLQQASAELTAARAGDPS